MSTPRREYGPPQKQRINEESRFETQKDATIETTAQNPARDQPERAPPSGSRNSDHLANERTFLAWIRTSISVIGLGFVVAKFSVWLRELAARLDGPVKASHSRLSLPLGIGMMLIGGVLALVAAWRYRRVTRAINSGRPASDDRTVLVVAIVVIAMTAALIFYMVITG
jgi:putative membrane protein